MPYFIVVLLMLIGCLCLPGCAKKPVTKVRSYAQGVSKKDESILQVKPPVHWGIRWRCTVDNNHHAWFGDANSLVAAQKKAKQLCELLSGGQGICRYKGCVQVEMR